MAAIVLRRSESRSSQRETQGDEAVSSVRATRRRTPWRGYRRDMTDSDLKHLRSAIALSRRSRDRGNQPFGALLTGPDGQVLLEAENTVVTGPDCTGHAVTNLMRLASRQFTSDFLAGCSLYASTEPCPMCGGAIFWGGLGRVVFALSERAFYQLVGPDCDGLRVGCRDVFAHGQRPIEVHGPALEDEALAVHLGFWGQRT
jgi:tRNA(Arg) A34 adenosine deaminase TadA